MTHADWTLSAQLLYLCSMMKRAAIRYLSLGMVSAVLLMSLPVWASECAPVDADGFQTMSRWQPFKLPGVDEASVFSVSDDELRIRSSDAASGVLWDVVVDMDTVRSLRWRVRMMWMPSRTELTERSRDDSPLRLMLVFSDNREELAAMTPDEDDGSLPIMALIRGRAGCDLLVYAAIPEDMPNPGKPNPSPVSDDIQVMPWSAKIGWQDVRVEPHRDFERAFGRSQPRWARIALVSDTDDTGGSAALSVDTVELCGE